MNLPMRVNKERKQIYKEEDVETQREIQKISSSLQEDTLYEIMIG